MRTWIVSILIISVLVGCTAGNATPTPTIVPLDRSALTPAAELAVSDAPPTATPIPFPSPTPTPTSFNTASLATPTPPVEQEAASPTPAASAAQVEIITSGLNVRQGPGVNFPAIGSVAQGDVLDINGISANGAWLQITTAAGSSGWISNQPAYVRVIGSLASLPVVDSASAGLPSPVAGQSQAASAAQIVFATRSGGDLYLINADGAGLRKLAGGVIDPVVSPDASQIAFTRWDSANMGAVYVLNLDGSGERVIASDIPRPKSPAWSQDGQQIIISFQHGGVVNPRPECRKFDSDDGGQLPNVSEITNIQRNSDGSFKICFIRREDLQWGLRRINLATGQAEDLPADLYSFNPTWNPQDSSQVIYDGLRGLMQFNIATGNLQPFTDDVRDTAPVFSPDGRKLALTYKQHDHWEVYTYDIATGSRQRLTKPPLLADPQYNSAAPAWSPDGSQIVFVTDRSGRWEIWVMNADGSNPHALFSTQVQAQLGLAYQGVNERLLNWIGSSATPAATTVTASSAAPGQVGGTSDVSLSGEWDFNFGTMSLTQRDMNVEGAYQWYGGADSGKIEGSVIPELNQFQGIWISNRNPNNQSLLRWQLGANGDGFSGTSEGGMTDQQWCGVPAGQPLPSGCGFSGVWQLRFGNPPGLTGQATLVQTGQNVRGAYVDSSGHTGEIVNGLVTVQSITEAKLTGTWRNDQGEQNPFEWRLDLTTGRTFQGRRDPGNSEWCGWREGTNEPEQCGWSD